MPGSDEPLAMSPHPRPWTDYGDVPRRFSGTAEYHHDFTLSDGEAASGSVLLEVETVGEIASVVLNGQDCGVLWTPPFRVDVTAAVRAGTNRLVIRVATPWRNRLIAEAAQHTGSIFAPMTQVFEVTATPLEAGLRGEVSLHLGG